MDLSFLKDENMDMIDKKNKMVNMKWVYIRRVNELEKLIKEYEDKICIECKHEFVTEREDGLYGELWDTCKKCGYFKRH